MWGDSSEWRDSVFLKAVSCGCCWKDWSQADSLDREHPGRAVLCAGSSVCLSSASDPEPGQAHLSLPHNQESMAVCAPSSARAVPVITALGELLGSRDGAQEEPVVLGSQGNAAPWALLQWGLNPGTLEAFWLNRKVSVKSAMHNWRWFLDVLVVECQL